MNSAMKFLTMGILFMMLVPLTASAEQITIIEKSVTRDAFSGDSNSSARYWVTYQIANQQPVYYESKKLFFMFTEGFSYNVTFEDDGNVTVNEPINEPDINNITDAQFFNEIPLDVNATNETEVVEDTGIIDTITNFFDDLFG
jgi:hypothetical protein